MDINEIIVFVSVVKNGSFRKAALELNMPNSTVSAKVSSLERRLGVTLLYRTTRKLSLTEAGEFFFQKSSKNVEELLAAEEELANAQGKPQGVLRITAPILFSSSILPELIQIYSEKYPLVKIELIATDETLDLISHNIDIAIRAGKLEDSSMIAKKLGETFFAPYAHPRYLKGKKKILHPKDLSEHTCLQFTPLGKNQWDFFGKSKVSIPLEGKIVLNELYTIKNLALGGHGVALLPAFSCQDEIKNKELVRILPEWKAAPRNISLVYPAHKFLSPKLSQFIKLASEVISKRIEKVI